MDSTSSKTSSDMTCTTCGGPLTSGPFGLRCARCVLSMVDAPEDEEDGYVAELFPELNLEGKVARGGFGSVYRAEHRRMRRPVALKFLDTLLARNPEAVALFEQEMISVGGLDHPGIVRAHDAGERDGHWYMIMEFVDGMDCGSLVRKHGKLPVAESCEIIRQAAVALGHAHGQGLVHRDVKPGNIMVSRGTEVPQVPEAVPSVASLPFVPSSVKILDFGLAGLAVAPVFTQPVATVGSTLFLGTLEYISPEQIESPAAVDARADIYSLGATLWRLLTGKTTHGGAAQEMSLYIAMKRITTEPVPSLATVRPDLPKPLIQLCDAMLSLDREKRPASAAEVARLIEPWCAGAELPRLFTDGPLPEKPFVFPKKNRRPLWAAATVLAAAAGVWVFPERSPVPAAPPEVRSVYSPELRARLQLDGESMPRLLSPDWEREHEYYSIHAFLNARFLPDGRIAYLSRDVDNVSIHTLQLGAPLETAVHHFAEKDKGDNMRTFVFAPDGHFAVNHLRDPKALHIRRVRPDGTLLPSLRYNFATQMPLIPYDAGMQLAIKSGKEVFDGFPWGMSIVTEGQVPPNTGLRPGDVLVADEGHNHIVPGIYETPPSLWRFRFDNDERVSLLAKGGNVPVDVTVSRHGVFMLNRTEVFADTEEDYPPNFTDRILRWDKDGFHPCTTDKPIHDPTGIAADPTSTDLYVVQGAFTPSVSRSIQRIVRLRLTAPDQYTVELIADRFGKVGRCGIAVSPDGRRIIVADPGNRCMVVLKRTGTTAPVLEGSAVFSEKVARFHDIPMEKMPRLLSTEWVVEREHLNTETFRKVDMARLRSDGRLMWIDRKNTLIIEPGPNGKWEAVGNLEGLNKFGVQPDTGNVVWTRQTHPDDLVIHRILPEGTKLALLGPDFTKEATAEARAATKAKRQAKGDEDGCANPVGMAFVTENTVPPGSGLRPGDVLYADEGHRDLAVYDRPIFPKVETFPGLWKFRFDSDEPAQRLGSLHPMWVKDGTHFPLDVTVSPHGVFLLNRSNTLPSGKAIPTDTNARVLRWEGSGFKPCTTDQPILSPAGIAADPLSADLFVLDGGAIVQPGVVEQRILRLRPAGPDRYTVEPFARKFRGFSYCGLQITDDGQRMVITDEKLGAVVVLKRKGIEPTPGGDAKKSTEETPLAFPGWQNVRWLHHQSKFASPRFAPGTGALYCTGKRLRLVPAPGEGAVNFVEESLVPIPAFSSVSLLTGHVAWNDGQSPSIGRATTNQTKLAPLNFTDPAPPQPGSFAFVTDANLPANTALRPGDALVAGSRNPKHPESTSGVWRFRFDNDEPPARLVAISDPAVNDITVSNAGVFLLTASGIQRWDGTAAQAVTLSQPLKSPLALAADPQTGDLFALEKKRLLRLVPTAPGTYTTEVLSEAIGEGVRAGLCFSEDGKRLLVGDYGHRKTWEMVRK